MKGVQGFLRSTRSLIPSTHAVTLTGDVMHHLLSARLMKSTKPIKKDVSLTPPRSTSLTLNSDDEHATLKMSSTTGDSDAGRLRALSPEYAREHNEVGLPAVKDAQR